MTAPEFPVIALGDDALTVLCGPSDIRHTLAHHLARDQSWIEVVPGKRDVTVAFDPHAESMALAMSRLRRLLESAASSPALARQMHTLAAVFGGEDGPDLAALAETLGIPAAQIIDEVLQSPLTVDMLGFTPGFAYLSGLSPMLLAERLAKPRVRVPAGSIGLITGQVGLYALEGPGGWPIIGRLQVPLFDRAAPNPFRLAPGDGVVLRPSGTL